MEEHPREYLCTITGDLMKFPYTITLNTHDYTYEKQAIELWMNGPNGDFNPLTMTSGLLSAHKRDNLELKLEIERYCLENNIVIDVEVPEVVEYDNDIDQIEEDYEYALDLELELLATNGLNPTNTLFILSLFGYNSR